MKLDPELQKLLSRRGAPILAIVFIVLIWIVQLWLQKPLPLITHALGSSTQHVNTLWIRQEISTWPTASANGKVFTMLIDSDSLAAIDIKTGATIWKTALSFEQSGARGILANQNTVFVVTTLNVDAYDAKTGELKWSTKLGDGHVSIICQLDSDVLRVYYGDKIYELDSGTGKILDTLPKGLTIWISGNTVLRGFAAFDKQTGKLLWNQGLPFYLDEGIKPIDLSSNVLLVAEEQGRGICALNLHTGQYNWCRPENFNSMMAIDHQSQLGYAMRDDFVLITIDLQTGNVLGETSFLSSEPINKQVGSVSSITVSDGIVVVGFSDSRQTFGLSIK